MVEAGASQPGDMPMSPAGIIMGNGMRTPVPGNKLGQACAWIPCSQCDTVSEAQIALDNRSLVKQL